MNPYNIYGYCYNYKPEGRTGRDPMLKKFRKRGMNEDDDFGSCTDDKGMFVTLRD
jgi:hypothetical protein